MQVHLVHAHPELRSFTAAMRDTVLDAFAERGDTVTVSDLYAMGFNPLLSRADFLAPDDPDRMAFTAEQRSGFERRTLAADILAEVDRLLAADLLVLTFPVWWFSMPAMLKGWIDRVFLAGPLYSGGAMYAKGGMTSRRAFVAASLGGRDYMFGEAAIHGPLETGMISHLLRGSLGVVGYDVLEPFWAFHAPYVDAVARDAMLAALRERIRHIETSPVLPMPDLARYDRRLRPLDE